MSPSVSARLLLTQSDARLIAFARAGHERAFEALVRRYRSALLGYCRRLLLSDERAEDALQQALMQAWLALRAGTEVQNAKAWLYRIVHNSALNALRVSGYDYCTLSESLSGAGAPQEDLDRRIAVREALAGLAALPAMQREALLRTAVEGSSHREAARELGLSEPALRGLVYRARAALRAAAGAFVPGPIVSWALGAGSGAPVRERVAEVSLGGGGAGVAGLLMKGGAVAITAGVLAAGIAVVHLHPRPVGSGPASAHRHTHNSIRQIALESARTMSRPTVGVTAVADVGSPDAATTPLTHRATLGVKPVIRHRHRAPVLTRIAHQAIPTRPNARGEDGGRPGADGGAQDGQPNPGAGAPRPGAEIKDGEGSHGGEHREPSGDRSGSSEITGGPSGQGTKGPSTSGGREDGGNGDHGGQHDQTEASEDTISPDDHGLPARTSTTTNVPPAVEQSQRESGNGD